ncbi:MAG: hypothetical protein ACRD2T_03460 [Thermoanaerobaculia bacterium]
MKSSPAPRFKTSQALLFAPAVVLAALAATALRNSLYRPVAYAKDSPDGAREALVFLEYSTVYPFTGEVRAVLELRRLPDRAPILTRVLGVHRWAADAVKAYQMAEWPEPGRLTLRSGDGSRTQSVRFPQEDDPAADPGSSHRRGR